MEVAQRDKRKPSVVFGGRVLPIDCRRRLRLQRRDRDWSRIDLYGTTAVKAISSHLIQEFVLDVVHCEVENLPVATHSARVQRKDKGR